MTPADIDKRIAKAVKALQLFVEIVSDLDIEEDGTGTAAGVGENADNVYDVEVCAGPFGFRSRPRKGAGGLMLKLGGEGGSAFIVGFRDRQYEISIEKGESVAFSASGAYTKWTDDGAGNGDVESQPAGTGKVKLAGADHPAPKFDTFEADLQNVLSAVLTALTKNCVNGAPLIVAVPPTPDYTTIFNFIAALAAHTYESEKVANG